MTTSQYLSKVSKRHTLLFCYEKFVSFPSIYQLPRVINRSDIFVFVLLFIRQF